MFDASWDPICRRASRTAYAQSDSTRGSPEPSPDGDRVCVHLMRLADLSTVYQLHEPVGCADRGTTAASLLGMLLLHPWVHVDDSSTFICIPGLYL